MMCGISGLLRSTPKPDEGRQHLVQQVEAMARTMRSRGPDAAGAWADPEAGVSLGFRRLAIVDLSPTGDQPMTSEGGRYTIVFNGEIYNHQELRKQLPVKFRGGSDTETLLAGIEHWGLEAILQRAVGMFAFAVWDGVERKLILARDRMGEKPLYFAASNGLLLFGSELKALRAHPDFNATVDPEALDLFLRYGCVPGPRSIYSGVQKLPPGTYLQIPARQKSWSLKPVVYWSSRNAALAGQAAPFHGSDLEAITHLEQLLRESVSRQMVADVPVGAFLSGGIDSSTVVALMQSLCSRPIKTFTVGFAERRFDEAGWARLVARHLKTDHTELYVTAHDALKVIEKLPAIYDEPFGDSSQIPTLLVSSLARQHVTVSLSGDGGDELFAGYSRYRRAINAWRLVGAVPVQLRNWSARHAQVRRSNQTAPSLPWGVHRWKGLYNIRHKLLRAANLLRCQTFQDLYGQMMSMHDWQDTYVVPSSKVKTAFSDPGTLDGLADRERQLRLLDQMFYLPDDILTKVDRAAMSVSLESRMPLLDHRIVEFAWNLPQRLLFRDGQTKWILRQVLKKYVSASLIDRPKMGFGIPLSEWLRTSLRPWAADLLSEPSLNASGLLNVPAIRRRWLEHDRGVRNWHRLIWNVLAFQAWYLNSATCQIAAPRAA